MTDYAALRRDPLSHLDYFTEWGGSAWERLVRIGLVDYLGSDLEGKRILEIGARFGRMSCLFGLLGATVTGIDIHEECLEIACAEARRLGVDSQVQFAKYSGDLGVITQKFDIAFSKSVLVVVPDMTALLSKTAQLLNKDGRVVFIENGRGGRFLRIARKLRHYGRWDFSRASFITPHHIDTLKSIFEIDRIVRSRIPPIYLLCGRRKAVLPSDGDGVFE